MGKLLGNKNYFVRNHNEKSRIKLNFEMQDHVDADTNFGILKG